MSTTINYKLLQEDSSAILQEDGGYLSSDGKRVNVVIDVSLALSANKKRNINGIANPSLTLSSKIKKVIKGIIGEIFTLSIGADTVAHDDYPPSGQGPTANLVTTKTNSVIFDAYLYAGTAGTSTPSSGQVLLTSNNPSGTVAGGMSYKPTTSITSYNMSWSHLTNLYGWTHNLAEITGDGIKNPVYKAKETYVAYALAGGDVSMNYDSVGNILIVPIGWIRNYTIPAGNLDSVTFNGVALTKLNKTGVVAPAPSFNSEIWYLLDPPTGVHTLTASFSTPGGGNYDAVSLTGVSFAGVSNLSPIGMSASESYYLLRSRTLIADFILSTLENRSLQGIVDITLSFAGKASKYWENIKTTSFSLSSYYDLSWFKLLSTNFSLVGDKVKKYIYNILGKVINLSSSTGNIIFGVLSSTISFVGSKIKSIKNIREGVASVASMSVGSETTERVAAYPPGVDYPNKNLTTTADKSLVLDAVFFGVCAAESTADASQTTIFHTLYGNSFYGASYKQATTAGSYNMQWSYLASTYGWGHNLVELKGGGNNYPVLKTTTSGGSAAFAGGDVTVSHNNDGNFLTVDLSWVRVWNLPAGVVNSVTYDGVSLTKINESKFIATPGYESFHLELWYLENPSVGTHNLVVNYSTPGGGDYSGAAVGVTSFSGAISIAPIAMSLSSEYVGYHLSKFKQLTSSLSLSASKVKKYIYNILKNTIAISSAEGQKIKATIYSGLSLAGSKIKLIKLLMDGSYHTFLNNSLVGYGQGQVSDNITTIYPNSLIYDAAQIARNEDVSPSVGQTLLWMSTLSGYRYGASYRTAITPGAYTMSWGTPTLNNNWEHCVAEIAGVSQMPTIGNSSYEGFGTIVSGEKIVSHANTGNLLIVSMSCNSNNGAYGSASGLNWIKYNGLNLTKFCDRNGWSEQVELWYLVDPPIGTYDIVANFLSTGSWYFQVTVAATSFSGVYYLNSLPLYTTISKAKKLISRLIPKAPEILPSVGANATNTGGVAGGSSAATTDITTLYPNSLVVDNTQIGINGGNTVGTGQTLIWKYGATGNIWMGSSYKAMPTAGANNMYWNTGGTNYCWADCLVELYGNGVTTPSVVGSASIVGYVNFPGGQGFATNHINGGNFLLATITWYRLAAYPAGSIYAVRYNSSGGVGGLDLTLVNSALKYDVATGTNFYTETWYLQDAPAGTHEFLVIFNSGGGYNYAGFMAGAISFTGGTGAASMGFSLSPAKTISKVREFLTSFSMSASKFKFISNTFSNVITLSLIKGKATYGLIANLITLSVGKAKKSVDKIINGNISLLKTANRLIELTNNLSIVLSGSLNRLFPRIKEAVISLSGAYHLTRIKIISVILTFSTNIGRFINGVINTSITFSSNIIKAIKLIFAGTASVTKEVLDIGSNTTGVGPYPVDVSYPDKNITTTKIKSVIIDAISYAITAGTSYPDASQTQIFAGNPSGQVDAGVSYKNTDAVGSYNMKWDYISSTNGWGHNLVEITGDETNLPEYKTSGATYGGTFSGGDKTYSYNQVGNMLIVYVLWLYPSDGGSLDSVTFNGVSLTRINKVGYVNIVGYRTFWQELWYLKDPSQGTHDVVCNFSSPGGSYYGYAITPVSFDGTETIGPVVPISVTLSGAKYDKNTYDVLIELSLSLYSTTKNLIKNILNSALSLSASILKQKTRILLLNSSFSLTIEKVKKEISNILASTISLLSSGKNFFEGIINQTITLVAQYGNIRGREIILSLSLSLNKAKKALFKVIDHFWDAFYQATATNYGRLTAASTNITTVQANSVIYDACGVVPTDSPNVGQTQLFSRKETGMWTGLGGSYKFTTTPGVYNMGWNNSSMTYWAHVLVEIATRGTITIGNTSTGGYIDQTYHWYGGNSVIASHTNNGNLLVVGIGWSHSDGYSGEDIPGIGSVSYAGLSLKRVVIGNYPPYWRFGEIWVLEDAPIGTFDVDVYVKYGYPYWDKCSYSGLTFGTTSFIGASGLIPIAMTPLASKQNSIGQFVSTAITLSGDSLKLLKKVIKGGLSIVFNKLQKLIDSVHTGTITLSAFKSRVFNGVAQINIVLSPVANKAMTHTLNAFYSLTAIANKLIGKIKESSFTLTGKKMVGMVINVTLQFTGLVTKGISSLLNSFVYLSSSGGRIIRGILESSLSLSVNISRIIGKIINSALTLTGNVVVSFVRIFTAGLSITVDKVNKFVNNLLQATINLSSTGGRVITQTFESILSLVGSIKKNIVIQRILSSIITLSSYGGKVIDGIIEATIILAGGFGKIYQLVVDVTLSLSGGFGRSFWIILDTTVSLIGSIQKSISKAFTTTFSLVGIASKFTNKLLQSVITLSSAGGRALQEIFNATITLITELKISKAFFRLSEATINLSSYGGKIIQGIIDAAILLGGAFGKYYEIILDVTLSLTGKLNKGLSRIFGVILSLSSNVTNAFVRMFTVALSFISNNIKRIGNITGTTISISGGESHPNKLTINTGFSLTAQKSIARIIIFLTDATATKFVRKTFNALISLSEGKEITGKVITTSISLSIILDVTVTGRNAGILISVDSVKAINKIIEADLVLTSSKLKLINKYFSGVIIYLSGFGVEGKGKTITTYLNLSSYFIKKESHIKKAVIVILVNWNYLRRMTVVTTIILSRFVNKVIYVLFDKIYITVALLMVGAFKKHKRDKHRPRMSSKH